MMKLKYSVVITTFNRLSLLKECLDNVYNQTYPFDHVIVVNNCSTDGTAEFLEEQSGFRNNLQIINLLKNSGGAGGFSAGIEAARSLDSDYLLIIDDDAMIDIDYIEKINEFAQYGKYEIYSGTVMTKGRINVLHRYNVEKNPIFRMNPVSEENYSTKTLEYDIGTFCGIVISINLIRKIGIPRADFFISFDDTEYCLRALKFSKTLNVNSAVLNHKEKSGNQIYTWRRYYSFRNRIIVYIQNSENPQKSKKELGKYYAVYSIKCLAKAVLLRSPKEQLKNIKQCYIAWKDGINFKTGISKEYRP